MKTPRMKTYGPPARVYVTWCRDCGQPIGAVVKRPRARSWVCPDCRPGTNTAALPFLLDPWYSGGTRRNS